MCGRVVDDDGEEPRAPLSRRSEGFLGGLCTHPEILLNQGEFRGCRSNVNLAEVRISAVSMWRPAYAATKTYRQTRPSVLGAPDTGNRREKRVEGGDDPDARQRVGLSGRLNLESYIMPTAGRASFGGTRRRLVTQMFIPSTGCCVSTFG